MEIPPSLRQLLDQRESLTRHLHEDPYSLLLFLERARTHGQLGYPDLAIADLYKALLLADEVLDNSGEFHHPAQSSAVKTFSNDDTRHRLLLALQLNHGPNHAVRSPQTEQGPDSHSPSDSRICQNIVQDFIIPQASVLLAHALASIGCLRTAYEYIQNTLRSKPSFRPAQEERRRIVHLAPSHNSPHAVQLNDSVVDTEKLPDAGLVRRDIYKWNDHEQDRMTEASLDFLNAELKTVAPKLEVRATNLPVLTTSLPTKQATTSKQLGVFAKVSLKPGELVLRERSLLTANARLHEPFCDACSAALPDLTASANGDEEGVGPISCSGCDDTIFCSQQCNDLAQKSYHGSICGADVDSVAKDVPGRQAVDALYTQLLFRSLAMACTQDKHPLELKEVKYIWGDFVTDPETNSTQPPADAYDRFVRQPRTLPFDFRSQILQPLHFLELLDINIFEAPHDLTETWVYNTLLAKFRGTASARISPRDGRPEVAAVHPLWCLANHSCDPNVEWEWAGEITFTARETRTDWTRKSETGKVEFRIPGEQGGIRAGDEILNHYVDVDLDVQGRREWGAGALGGSCRCQRCVWEAAENELENLKV